METGREGGREGDKGLKASASPAKVCVIFHIDVYEIHL